MRFLFLSLGLTLLSCKTATTRDASSSPNASSTEASADSAGALSPDNIEKIVVVTGDSSGSSLHLAGDPNNQGNGPSGDATAGIVIGSSLAASGVFIAALGGALMHRRFNDKVVKNENGELGVKFGDGKRIAHLNVTQELTEKNVDSFLPQEFNNFALITPKNRNDPNLYNNIFVKPPNNYKFHIENEIWKDTSDSILIERNNQHYIVSRIYGMEGSFDIRVMRIYNSQKHAESEHPDYKFLKYGKDTLQYRYGMSVYAVGPGDTLLIGVPKGWFE